MVAGSSFSPIFTQKVLCGPHQWWFGFLFFSVFFHYVKSCFVYWFRFVFCCMIKSPPFSCLKNLSNLSNLSMCVCVSISVSVRERIDLHPRYTKKKSKFWKSAFNLITKMSHIATLFFLLNQMVYLCFFLLKNYMASGHVETQRNKMDTPPYYRSLFRDNIT